MKPYPVEKRNVIKQVWVGEGKNTEIFAELWTLAFRESEEEEAQCYFQ